MNSLRRFRDMLDPRFRALVRLAIAQARSHVGTGEAIRDQDGDIIADPSGDELIPPVSHEILLAQTSSLVLDPTLGRERGGRMRGTCSNPNTSKRD